MALVNNEFGGIARVKNLFGQPEKVRSDRFHLASIMLTVVYVWLWVSASPESNRTNPLAVQIIRMVHESASDLAEQLSAGVCARTLLHPRVVVAWLWL